MSLFDPMFGGNQSAVSGLGMGLLSYAQPGERKNLARELMWGLQNGATMQQMKDKLERQKQQDARQKKLDGMAETKFGMDMFTANNQINRQAASDQRLDNKTAAFNNYVQSFNPESNLFQTPGALAGADEGAIGLFRQEQGLRGGVNPSQLFKQNQGFTLSAGQHRFDNSGNPIASVPMRPTVQKNPVKVVDESGNVTYVRPQDAVGMSAPVDSFSVKTNADGSTSILKTSGRGGVSASGLSGTTKTSVEKDIIDQTDTLSQLKEIRTGFKPEFQRLGFRFDHWKTNLGDKISDLPFMSNLKMESGEREKFSEFDNYKADTLKIFTKTLSDLSGAAVTATEAERAQGWFPNVGTSIFNGDGPNQFETKLKNFEKFTKDALIRRQHALENGVKWQNIPLSKVPDIIRAEGDKLLTKFSNLPPDQAKEAVKRELIIKYGALGI